MGLSLTFSEDIVLENGIELNTAYASFKMGSPKIHKIGEVGSPGGGYRIDGALSFWVSKNAANLGKAPFMERSYGFEVPELPSTNLYQFLYEKIIELYESESTCTVENDI